MEDAGSIAGYHSSSAPLLPSGLSETGAAWEYFRKLLEDKKADYSWNPSEVGDWLEFPRKVMIFNSQINTACAPVLVLLESVPAETEKGEYLSLEKQCCSQWGSVS